MIQSDAYHFFKSALSLAIGIDRQQKKYYLWPLIFFNTQVTAGGIMENTQRHLLSH